ncbi:MAG: RNA polymerase sigma factor [Rhodospirillaceae bacterium]|nr:RNA polymerase sigma factor [Rhodospirillaceae bacterium]
MPLDATLGNVIEFERTTATASLSMLDDDRLMVMIGSEDRDAFGVLAARHLARCIAIAYRTLGDRQDAEDISHDAMLRVWRHAPKWKTGGAQFTTWLYRVVVNLCIDRTRRVKPTAGEVPEDLSDGKPDAADTLESNQTADQVREAVMALPDRQKEALVLCFFEGVSNAEAAEILEVSVGALEQLLVRARRSLRVTLAGLMD